MERRSKAKYVIGNMKLFPVYSSPPPYSHEDLLDDFREQQRSSTYENILLHTALLILCEAGFSGIPRLRHQFVCSLCPVIFY